MEVGIASIIWWKEVSITNIMLFVSNVLDSIIITFSFLSIVERKLFSRHETNLKKTKQKTKQTKHEHWITIIDLTNFAMWYFLTKWAVSVCIVEIISETELKQNWLLQRNIRWPWNRSLFIIECLMHENCSIVTIVKSLYIVLLLCHYVSCLGTTYNQIITFVYSAKRSCKRNNFLLNKKMIQVLLLCNLTMWNYTIWCLDKKLYLSTNFTTTFCLQLSAICQFQSIAYPTKILW